MQKTRLDEQMRKAESKNKHGETRLLRTTEMNQAEICLRNDQSNDQQNAAHSFKIYSHVIAKI